QLSQQRSQHRDSLHTFLDRVEKYFTVFFKNRVLQRYHGQLAKKCSEQLGDYENTTPQSAVIKIDMISSDYVSFLFWILQAAQILELVVYCPRLKSGGTNMAWLPDGHVLPQEDEQMWYLVNRKNMAMHKRGVISFQFTEGYVHSEIEDILLPLLAPLGFSLDIDNPVSLGYDSKKCSDIRMFKQAETGQQYLEVSIRYDYNNFDVGMYLYQNDPILNYYETQFACRKKGENYTRSIGLRHCLDVIGTGSYKVSNKEDLLRLAELIKNQVIPFLTQVSTYQGLYRVIHLDRYNRSPSHFVIAKLAKVDNEYAAFHELSTRFVDEYTQAFNIKNFMLEHSLSEILDLARVSHHDA
ncbi:MAG: hypothetical protein KDI39_18030, partial [Pseudomonadales bacterium]|nr:hypothetical protein [Pseudomonadales bacterium]